MPTFKKKSGDFYIKIQISDFFWKIITVKILPYSVHQHICLTLRMSISCQLLLGSWCGFVCFLFVCFCDVVFVTSNKLDSLHSMLGTCWRHFCFWLLTMTRTQRLWKSEIQPLDCKGQVGRVKKICFDHYCIPAPAQHLGQRRD